MKLNLERPLVFFDLETTGLNIGKDKIVELSMLKVNLNGEEEVKTMLINPGIHIPRECSEVHGIWDADVKDKPKFEDVADEVLAFIGDAGASFFSAILKVNSSLTELDLKSFFSFFHCLF